MTDEEIRKLLEGATPGPWVQGSGWIGRTEPEFECLVTYGLCADDAGTDADARLMAAAPELARDLLLTRNDLAEHEAALAEIHAACVAAGIPEETVSETGTTTRHRTAQLVAWMAEELAKARSIIRDTCEALDGGETEPERLAEGVALLAGRYTGVCAESRGRLRQLRALGDRLEQRDAWLAKIDGGDHPCNDPVQLREWAMRALRGDEVPDEG